MTYCHILFKPRLFLQECLSFCMRFFCLYFNLFLINVLINMLHITSSVTVNSASWGRASEISISSESSTKSDGMDFAVVFFDKFSLPYFNACMFATILEDAITQLKILHSCNTDLRFAKTKADMTQLLADKYGVAKKAVKDELDDVDPKNLHCLEYKLNKLENDRHLLSDILIDTYLDLSKHRRSSVLNNHVAKLMTRNEHLENVTDDEARNKMIYRDLNRQLRQQRNHIKSTTYDINTVIENLKTRVADAALNIEICSRYVENWQNARTEQNNGRIYFKELPQSRNIEYYKQRTDQEHRVHTEVELLQSILINETLDKVEHWMAKYENDMEKIDLRIQRKRNEYENTEERRIKMEETLKNHAEEIENWISFKEKREADRQYRENMHKSACMIQAWWRGLLVRFELGPYKPTKKKPKESDKDKKKKK